MRSTLCWVAAWSGIGVSPGSIAAQLVSPPTSLWGDVPQSPEGLQVGSVEVLAGLLLALALLFAATTWMVRAQRRLVAVCRQVPAAEAARLRPRLLRLRKGLALCVYLVVPGLSVATTLLAGQRALLGIEVSLLATLVSFGSLVIGGSGLISWSPAGE